MADYGKLLYDNNIIYFGDEINEQSIKQLINQLLSLSTDKNNNGSVLLYINSPGGTVYDAFAGIDIIKNLRLPVNTYGLGCIASAALLLYLAGRNRVLSYSSMLLSHQYNGWKFGKYHELLAQRKEEDILYEQLVTYYQERTGLTKKVIRDKLLGKSDAWITPDEAFKYNITHHIIKNNKIIKSKDKK